MNNFIGRIHDWSTKGRNKLQLSNLNYSIISKNLNGVLSLDEENIE